MHFTINDMNSFSKCSYCSHKRQNDGNLMQSQRRHYACLVSL